MRNFKTLAAIACVALVSAGSVATAQSSAKAQAPMVKETMQKPMAQEAMAESMSKAFTNGYNIPSTGIALEGYCPVCYIAANKAAKGSPEFSHEHNGVTYWFVSEEVKQTFVANPEMYLPAYGGWCATGVALGQRFPVDPTNFKVVNGRIMLFLKNANIDGVEIWNRNEAENLRNADANWTKLKG